MKEKRKQNKVLRYAENGIKIAYFQANQVNIQL